MKNRKALIISISGYFLTKDEKKLFTSKIKPWGIILFKRNIKDFTQTKKLIESIKKLTNDKNYPVLVDQEGGDVTRLPSLNNKKTFSQKFFGDLYTIDKSLAFQVYKKYIDNLCDDLHFLGFNINTVPVLDLSQKNTHKIIVNRSYSSDKTTIKSLGKFCINKFEKKKIFTVIKHIPGHGCANADSHIRLPEVNKSYSKLMKEDFNCFKEIKSKFAMTAHIKLNKIDKDNVVTFSNKIIKDIIRKKIGFKGILISDDISMKALKYDITTNAIKSLKAGCNIALYCAGKYSESKKLLLKVPELDSFTRKKTSEFYNQLR